MSIDTIKLSQQSQELMGKVNSLATFSLDSVGLKDFLDWFNPDDSIISDKNKKFLLESMRVSLLKDLLGVFEIDKDKSAKNKPHWSGKVKLTALAVAGTTYFGCEGFDSISSLLGLFHLPILPVALSTLTFSLLSIVVFIGFDLAQISNHLGVSFNNARGLVDVYCEQLEQIKGLKKVLRNNPNLLNSEERQSLAQALIKRSDTLNTSAKIYQVQLSAKRLNSFQTVIAVMTGVLFFGNGFFAGQTCGMALASLFVASATPTFLPVLLVSLAIGLAALSIYWFVEMPSVKNLVGQWMGLDKDKIEHVINKSKKYSDELNTRNVVIKNNTPPGEIDNTSSAEPTPQPSLHGLFSRVPSNKSATPAATNSMRPAA